jgi:hypothetical protein
MTAALRAIQDEAGSKLPALGYTVPMPVGNILLTACGPVIVALMSIGNDQARENPPCHDYRKFSLAPLLWGAELTEGKCRLPFSTPPVLS